MRILLLGPLVVDAGEVPLSRRDRVVLSALAVHGDEVVTGERLADALWGDELPASWSKVVQGCVVRLRKALGAGAIRTDAHGYRLAIPPDEVDVRRFEYMLGRARELLALDEPDRAIVAVDEALALWRGRPLLDVEEWEPARIEVGRLDELRLEAEDLRLDAALRAGRHVEVLASARAAVEAVPTRERRWELLALAQYRAGRQGDALRTLQSARGALARELGVDPGPALLALERAVLDQDGALSGPVAPPDAMPWCPWPGLLPYDVGDSEGFFGRDAEVDDCLDRLAENGVVVLVGPSGSGKSSLARAGVAARLRRNGERVVIVVPGGAHPLDSLSVIPTSSVPPTLVVDQCEEVFTLCDDPVERTAFLDALVAHAEAAPLIVALRADRLGEISGHSGMAALIERGIVLVGSLDEQGLRTAVEGPAQRAALLLEPGLVDLVIRDVRSEPGALPLLSHALHQTWVRREGRTLTVAAYRETGGIAGAVAQSAERVYAEADAAERSKLRDLLVRLVTSAENGEPTRVRLARDTIEGDRDYETLVERLVAARLLTSDDHTVELAHEAVARAWPRMHDWLDEDVEGMRVLRHLTSAAGGWGALGRPETELYRGPRLAQARAWRDRTDAQLTPVEADFLEASTRAEDADLLAVQEQVERDRRSVRRLRRLVGVAAVLTALALIVSLVAVGERRRADDEAMVAEARRVAAEALVARPQDRALLLAVEAVNLWDSPETRGSLLTTINRSPNLAGVIRGPGRLLELDLSSDGTHVATADVLGDVSVYDLARRADVLTIGASGVSYDAPAFSPDGDEVAVARMSNECFTSAVCADFGVDVFAASAPGEPSRTYRGAWNPAADIAYSSDGQLVAAVPAFAYASDRDNITVWRAGEPDRPMLQLTLPDRGIELRATPDLGPPGWVAFSPDGALLYASGAGPVAVFDLRSGTLVRQLGGRGGLALSPDGSTLAVRGEGSDVVLVDTSTGAAIANLTGHDGIVTTASFRADGGQIATTSTDETVAVWDPASGERLQVLSGHAGAVLDAGYPGDGSTLHSIAGDRTIFEWDPKGSSGLSRRLLEGSHGAADPRAVLVSPLADSIILANGPMLRVDTASGRTTELEDSDDPEVGWSAYAPDGQRLVAVRYDGTTRLWDLRSGRLIASHPGRGTDNFGAVAFTGDGRHVLVADADGTVVELDGESLRPTGRSADVGVEPAGIRTARDGVFAVTSLTSDPADGTEIVFGDLDDGTTSRVHVDEWGPRANFDASGTRYAVGGFDGSVSVVDVETGRVSGRSDPIHSGPVAWVAFSPDGRTLASIGFDGLFVLSEAATATPRARSRPGPPNVQSSFSFSPQGDSVRIGYQDGTVIGYRTDVRSWLDHACAVAGRNLTPHEWRDAFGPTPVRRTCPDN